VVAFYPGCVYAESDLPLVYPHIYTDNAYLAFRPDKVSTQNMGVCVIATRYGEPILMTRAYVCETDVDRCEQQGQLATGVLGGLVSGSPSPASTRRYNSERA
jgi:hypothetical protein